MSSFALKFFAVICMILDHVGHAFFPILPEPVYISFRLIGRIAMPIFCFLVAEGLFYTKDVRKYLFRMLFFALISEIPFDLFNTGVALEITHQNVFFTLFLGLLGITLFDAFLRKNAKVLALISILTCAAAAYLLKTDYNAFGVFYIFSCYLFRKQKAGRSVSLGLGIVTKTMQAIISYGKITIAPLMQIAALAAIAPINIYNNKRGPSGKALQWGFYIFYPFHLFVIYAVKFFLQ